MRIYLPFLPHIISNLPMQNQVLFLIISYFQSGFEPLCHTRMVLHDRLRTGAHDEVRSGDEEDHYARAEAAREDRQGDDRDGPDPGEAPRRLQVGVGDSGTWTPCADGSSSSSWGFAT